MGHCNSLFRRLVVDPLQRKARVDPRSHGLWRNLADKVALGQCFARVLQFSHVRVIAPVLHTCLLTYLLTYSMVQSPSWEANWFAASQEIPRILWNPKVRYRTHKRPPPVPILDQPKPVHIPTSHLLEIHPNIIHPSTPRSPQWLFPSGFPTKTLYAPLYTCLVIWN